MALVVGARWFRILCSKRLLGRSLVGSIAAGRRPHGGRHELDAAGHRWERLEQQSRAGKPVRNPSRRTGCSPPGPGTRGPLRPRRAIILSTVSFSGSYFSSSACEGDIWSSARGVCVRKWKGRHCNRGGELIPAGGHPGRLCGCACKRSDGARGRLGPMGATPGPDGAAARDRWFGAAGSVHVNVVRTASTVRPPASSGEWGWASRSAILRVKSAFSPPPVNSHRDDKSRFFGVAGRVGLT